MELGAIDIETGNWTHPRDASKTRLYRCIDCNENLILKQGKIRKHHFSHCSKSMCTYFDRPSESQIHKDAKHKLAELLKKRKEIEIYINCNDTCRGYNHSVRYKEGDCVVIEYRHPQGKYIADVAIINNGTPRYIFEIMNTHRTETDRPEPWFELDAKEICTEEFYTFDCIRKRTLCNCCKAFNENWLYKIPKIKKPEPCISCENMEYTPVWKNGYRSICPSCIEYNIVTDDIKRLGIFGKGCLL